jgi:hypothetical protein
MGGNKDDCGEVIPTISRNRLSCNPSAARSFYPNFNLYCFYYKCCEIPVVGMIMATSVPVNVSNVK